MSGSQTLELREYGGLKMLKTPRVLLAIWPLKSCADKIIQRQLITLQWELWPMNACLVGGHTLENQEKRSGIIFYQNKYKSKKGKFQEDGASRLPISSIKWFKENHKIDLEIMELLRSKIILGLETFHGKISTIRDFVLLSFHPWRTISIRKTSTKNGKILMTQSSRRTWPTSDVILYKPYSMDTIMITNWLLLPRTKLRSTQVLTPKTEWEVKTRMGASLTTLSFCYSSSTTRYLYTSNSK